MIPKRSATTCSALNLGSPVPTPIFHPGAQIQRWGVLGRALVTPKRSATTCSALILGSPVPTPTLHPRAQMQRWGVTQIPLYAGLTRWAPSVYPVPVRTGGAVCLASKGRLVTRALLDRWVLQLVYVDDLHVVTASRNLKFC